MALQSVQVRPVETANHDEVETFIESLINQPVSSTHSSIPVFTFKTSEENVQLIKDKFGKDISVDAVNV